MVDVELLSRFALYVAHVVAWVNVGVAGALSLGLAMMVVSEWMAVVSLVMMTRSDVATVEIGRAHV